MLNGRGSDKRIWNFETVAPGISIQEGSSNLSGFIVGNNTVEGAEEIGDQLVFLLPRACPDFRGNDGRTKNHRAGAHKFRPSQQENLIPRPLDLDGDVRIQENVHRMPNRSRRVPLRRSRT